MKSKHYIFYIAVFLLGMVVLHAQENEVPDTPEEVRVLPTDFKDAYTDKAYDYVETTSALARFRKWVIDKISGWFNVNGSSAGFIFNGVKTVFYIAVILLVIYLIIKIILNKEIRWIFKKREKENQNLNFDIDENIREVDFNSLISKAVSNKDYRLAIRYYYLYVLKKLDQYDVIAYDVQKTTYDYQIEVEGSKYASSFSKATYYYTYIWYGEYTIDENEYEKTSSVYDKLVKQFAS